MGLGLGLESGFAFGLGLGCGLGFGCGPGLGLGFGFACLHEGGGRGALQLGTRVACHEQEQCLVRVRLGFG